LKDEFGGQCVRVRGHLKFACNLGFGILALTAESLIRLCAGQPQDDENADGGQQNSARLASFARTSFIICMNSLSRSNNAFLLPV
jgi:hypothetical protein